MVGVALLTRPARPVDRGRNARRAPERLRTVGMALSATAPAARRRRRLRFRIKNDAVYWRRRAGVFVALVALPLVVPAPLAAIDAARSSARGLDLRVVGATDGAVLNRAALAKVTFSLAVPGAAADHGVSVRVDGRPLAPAVADGRLTWSLPELAEGRHVVTVSKSRPLVLPGRTRSFRFTLDDTPPRLALQPQAKPVNLDAPVTVVGTVEPGVEVLADGKAVAVRDGRFELRYESPPAGSEVVATDRAGNVAVQPVVVPVEVPPTRAVHMSGYSWVDKRFREPVLAMADRGLIDTIELDLKEEDGFITYKSGLEYHRSIGAVRGLFDLKAAVDELHARNLRVVGRLVAFRDPVLAQAAWKAGRRNEVVQTPDGQQYAGYGGFTNFADPAVRKYNIDIAEEAARLGVDDILYDYVRRPDGALDSMRFPGITVSPEDAVVEFLTESRARLRPLKVYQGASVFGIAADRPTQIAQDVTKMAPAVDYLAPMVYPSHWNKGEYGVADPNRSPYEITSKSLALFQAKVQGTPVKIVPWLQDFSLGVTYGPAEVAAQIKAAADIGIHDWILWDPAVTYTEAGLPPPK